MTFTFNDSGTRIATSSMTECQVFQLPPQTPFKRLWREQRFAVSFITIVDESPLVILVGSRSDQENNGSSRSLQLFDVNENIVITEMQFSTAILSVKVNPTIMAVILERQTHLFGLSTLKPLTVICTTKPLNKRGLGTLSGSSSGSCFYAFPHSNAVSTDQPLGDVVVLDAIGLQQITLLPAHRHPIVGLEISHNGSRIATASVQGTVIKIFSNPNSQLLFQLRRGNKPVEISQLSFSLNADMLVVASSSDTIHVFRCAAPSSKEIRSVIRIPQKAGTKSLCRISEDCGTLNIVSVPTEPSSSPPTLMQFSIPQMENGTSRAPMAEWSLNSIM